jgi:hypothetical protein
MNRMMCILAAFLLLGCPAEKDHHGEEHTGDTGDTDWNLSTSMESEGGTFWVMYSTSPDPIATSESFSATFMVHNPDDHEEMFMDAVVTAVDAAMPAHGHGMNVAPEITDNGNGTFTASPLEFMMSGHWEIYADVTRGDVSEQTTFHVMCCGD